MKIRNQLPMDTYCMVCGAQLVIKHPRRVWVRGLIDRGRWQATVTCPGCGAHGNSGGTVRIAAGHPSRNPIKVFVTRLLRQDRTGGPAGDPAMGRPSLGGDGSLDLDQFLDQCPYPVYGLKGRPMGLRLRSPGRRGGHGLAGAVDRVRLGYVSGDFFEPEKAVEIVQGVTEQDARDQDSGPGAIYSDLASIKSLIGNYAPKGRRENDPFIRDFHRDWNVRRLENTPWQQTSLRVNGIDIEARFVYWDTPHRVVLLRLALVTHSLSVAALNLSWDDLRQVLSSLVVLLDDQETVSAHQTDVDEATRLLRERNSHGPHGDGHQT